MIHSNPSDKPVPADAAEFGASEDKRTFEEPRLTFIEPKLTPRGDLREVTGFLGTFSP